MINVQEGDNLPVSAFEPDGTVPTGTTQYEKRGVAVEVPQWIRENCIQCTQCSLVCPHAAIRPYLHTPDELKEDPKNILPSPRQDTRAMNSEYRVSPDDCLGAMSASTPAPPKKRPL